MENNIYFSGDITVKFSENVATLDLEGTHISCDQKLNLIDTKIDSTGNSEKLEGLFISLYIDWNRNLYW